MEEFKGRNQDRQEFKVVGRKDIPGRLSYALAAGAAKYAREVVVPGMIHGKILRSPYGRARIKGMDTSRAKALPGVKAVITWEDEQIRAMPSISALDPPLFSGSPTLAFQSIGIPVLGNEADREGDEIGVCVAAESEELCDEALKLVDIEWEVLPHLLDPREALRGDAPILHPELNLPSNCVRRWSWEDGDVEAAFREADHVVEYDRFFPFFNTHKPNPFAIVAWWEQDHVGGEGKTLFIESDSYTFALRAVMTAFNLPEDKIRWLTICSGGQYCDLVSRRLVILGPLLAERTGMPVRIANTRRDSFDLGGGGADYTHVKIGFTNDGMLTAVHASVLSSIGTRAGIISDHSIEFFRMTRCPNIKSDCVSVFTNTARQSADPGLPYNWEVFTTAMWRIADELAKDPAEVMLKNCHTPQPSLKLCIDKGKEAIGWDRKRHAPGAVKLPNGKMHGMSFRYHDAPRHPHAIYTCTLILRSDGKVYVPHRGSWRGVFCEDACALVVAEELGARPEDVVIQFDANASATAVGGGSDGGGAATWVAKEAAIDLKALLLKDAAAVLKVAPEELDTRDSTVFIKADPQKNYAFGMFAADPVFGWPRDLTTSYTGRPPLSSWKRDTRYRILDTMNALFCEVEVDTETGDVEITNYVAACDVGKAIRPSSVEGQIEGQLVMNTASAKLEEYVWDEKTGVLLNGNDLEYKVPTILDVPPIEPVVVETRLGNGCYGATGISHQIVDKGIVACAVHNAIGKWIDSVPITPDKVLEALGKI